MGRLWQINYISVAQEHFCTAVTQKIMAKLYPYIISDTISDRNVVAACCRHRVTRNGNQDGC
ncbi:B12-binding domain-containing protein [Methanolobus bombayensis]|uniref:B12-binding domain-containing protein n=1 Tax=Methanolobus bombayensis TaxID=38023 RepID=UPI003CC90A21